MFIGHYAVGFAFKRFAPRAGSGPLMAAPILPDLMWPFFLLLGWESVRIDPGTTAFTSLAFDSYPISHSLLTDAGWALGLAAAYWGITKYARGAVVIAIGVISHWVLDAVSHRPDMPLYPGGPLVGLGLWNSIPGTLLVESVMFAGGLWLYVRTTKARDRVGSSVMWIFVAFLLVIYVANAFGSPPPNPRAIAWLGLAQWVIPFWAAWFDRHREPRV